MYNEERELSLPYKDSSSSCPSDVEAPSPTTTPTSKYNPCTSDVPMDIKKPLKQSRTPTNFIDDQKLPAASRTANSSRLLAQKSQVPSTETPNCPDASHLITSNLQRWNKLPCLMLTLTPLANAGHLTNVLFVPVISIPEKRPLDMQ